MDKIKQKFKGLLKKIGLIAIAVFAVITIIGGIIVGFIEADVSASAYSGNYYDYVNLGDYIVKTDEEGAMPALTKSQLITAINGAGFTEKMTAHYIDWADAIIEVQSKYKVNAAFTISVIQNEHGGGGPGGDINWGSIPSSTYNIFSISKSGGGWMSYDGYEDAIDAFGNLIANTGPYFSENRYTVEKIKEHYDNNPAEHWDTNIQNTLKSAYSAVAETIHSTGNISGQKIADEAARVMQYMMDNNYYYKQGNYVPMSKNGNHCDCSAFVCWVLYNLGITDAQNNGWQLTTYDMPSYFTKKGWKSVGSYSELEPGDIVLWTGHVQIFAYRESGVNYYVNCGWDPCDHTSVYETLNEKNKPFETAWRIPN